MRQMFKYDRIFLTLSILSLADFLAFLYFLGRSHQDCEYFAVHWAESTLFALTFLVAGLAAYSFVRISLKGVRKPTNAKLFGIISGMTAIIVGIVFIGSIISFGLFFGDRC